MFRHRRSVDQPDNELLLISAVEASAMIRRGEIKSIDLVEAYIERVLHVNGLINAMVADNFEQARMQANNIDNYLEQIDKSSEEYHSLAKRKPFLGVPFTVKDNVLVKGFLCTAGVPARRSASPCTQDAEAVRRLKEAGAVLLGITNVPELALWWETSNTLYGCTNNPYDLRKTPGGSSGGEGALISSAGSVIGLGNDVGGSLRIPAVFNGIFGLKPGPGVVPSRGLYPEIHGGYLAQMATAGPLCRYAKILAGDEVADNKLNLSIPVDFRKIRIFYMEDLNSLVCEDLHPEMRESVRKAAKYFEKKYDRSTHRLDLALAHHAAEMFVTSFDEADYPKITESMANFEFNVNCYTELLKSICGGNSSHTLPAIITGIHSTLPQPSKETKGFVDSKRDQLRREIADLLGQDGILLFPAFSTTAPFNNQALFTPFNFIYNGLWNALALPVIAVPLGLSARDNLPVGVQIVAAPDQERLLIAAAQDLEEGFGGWVPPRRRRRFHS
ncbi:amidase domain-containing protein [Ditylenchus destructor]|uniref:Amidase domain-containing protein n=1 Tax=Ditylenchus destructor TaxID=166010 RepID=A0AAD4RB20_9BILA|nr:amidase domain-containing protein [Ditylenchus destructor]